MFVYNVKFNKNKIIKIGFIIAITIAILILAISSYKIFKKGNEVNVNDEIKNGVYNITANNYTNILKSVHDNIDTYIGQKIHFTGYVYRVPDINENEFILARDMVINSNLQTLVVGFLCKCDNALEYEDKVWIEAEGIIEKGNYYGEIPIIKLTKIKKVDKPNEEFVYPPDSSFVPTAVLF